MHDHSPGTDDSYPIGWQVDLCDAHDAEWNPRYGRAFEGHRPDHALQARIATVAASYVAGRTEGAHAALDLAADTLEAVLLTDDHRAVGRLVLGMLELLAAHLTGASGADLAVARLEGEVEAQREAAARDAGIAL